MICSICDKEMGISDGLIEMDGKRCHKSCKDQNKTEWRKTKGLDHF